MAIFVSHSKYDIELKKYFSQIFAHIGLKARFMEWENLENKYAGKEISDIIRGSLLGENIEGVVVLLGRQLLNQPAYEFTHNWVNFEVGVSAGVKKPVWVFEEFGQFYKFPIPYVTNYCQFTLDSDEHIKQIGMILDLNFVKHKIVKPTYSVKCPYSNCNAEYSVWSEIMNRRIYCPVCRREISFPNN